MNKTNQQDYSSISPSARVLLLLKGLTDIPFAKEAAALIPDPDHYITDNRKKDFGFWARVAHFESRYNTINQLLADQPVKNILELSSGFSFRGLELTRDKDVHYIDTDLPVITGQKTILVKELKEGLPPAKGKLEILPLNALDEDDFFRTVDHFGPGEIAIVNEGLLVYLNEVEKVKLCSIIHKILSQRGGCWITADIYIRHEVFHNTIKIDDKFQKFLEQHQTEEKKFGSIDEAEAFFRQQGFVIDKEAEPDYFSLSAFNNMIKLAKPEDINEMKKAGKVHATWRLKVAG